ncbi:MAG TPA: phenylalanine--tRNA ligase subunit beta [Chthoniobacterales bacterium]|jgi:phenylalanyl-tRNA synthetase beta chain
MKFSVNWLGEFVELPNDIAQLAELLTLAGVEIEGIEKRGANFENVVVAQIVDSKQHPNADRLSVCQVDDGRGTPRQIVCGAKNYKVGDKVPLALPGAVLPNELKIKASKLRGVESQGMLCSAKELALSDESAGLLILPNESKIGTPIGEIFPNDTILDVEITPNRADLLSHYGLAREIAALTQKLLRTLEIDEPATKDDTIRISAPNECPFYSARRIENLAIGPSPGWLRAKLEAVGLRAINNVVDVTNFVMLELGQPLHAFDADKIEGAIEVRLARPNEKFLALDGRTYNLTPKSLLIADGARAIGIGGVMGGEESGVTTTTRNIILESAYFLPANIRRTARELNLPSDASYRFERGVDPEMILRASARAAELLREVAAGVPASETAVAGTLPAAPAGFSLRYKFCDRVLGTKIVPNECDRILESFGLEKLGGTAEQSTWKIPSYRADLRREVDLVEEVGRVHGIDRIPSANRSSFVPVSAADQRYDFEAKLRQRLIARGFCEVRTSSLVARDSLGKGFARAAVELRNPLSEDHVALRPSLIPGLSGALERNLRAGTKSIRLFEIGAVFLPPDGREVRRVALLVSGLTENAPNWRGGGARALDLFDLKGAIESLGWFTPRFERTENSNFALAASVFAKEHEVGVLGQLSSGEKVFSAELDLPNDAETGLTSPRFHELQRFPSVSHDIALFAPISLTNSEILRTIAEANEPLLGEVALFDLFSGKGAENLGAERKSLAYTLTYRDKNRTLTHDEVNGAHDRIRARLRSSLGVELRE